MQGNRVRLPLLYLVVTALSGLFMRSMGWLPVPLSDIPYDHILHAHSHLALLGWVYMALFLLLIRHFCKEEGASLQGSRCGDRDGGEGRNGKEGKQLRAMYGLTQLTLIGMFAAFLLQGYALFSIALSTVQILLSYWFAWWLWQQLSRQRSDASCDADAAAAGVPLSVRMAKGSLVCLVASSAGPWTLAVLSANQLQGSPLYEAAIYFYLHLQYNGWFTLALFAILLRVLEKRRVPVNGRLTGAFYRLYAWALLPAYLLSILWMDQLDGWLATLIASAAAVCQWGAVLLLLYALHLVREAIFAAFGGWSRVLLLSALAIFFVKSTLEIGPAIPVLSEWIYDSRSIVVGYLHLTLLGFVSLFALALFLEQRWLDAAKGGVRIGLAIFLAGFMANEFVLFLQGLYDGLGIGVVSGLERWLWLASAAMAAGAIAIWTNGNGGTGIWHSPGQDRRSISSLSAEE